MMEQSDIAIGKSYYFDPRPAPSWNRRVIRSPLDQSAAAGMYADSLKTLSKGKIRRLMDRFMRLGMSQDEARQAVLQMIQAQQISNRTL